MRDTLRASWAPLAHRAARAYVAGSGIGHASRYVRGLSARGFRSTIGYWNASGDPPGRVAAEARASIETLIRFGRSGHLSIKAPALGFDRALTTDLIGRALATGLGVRFDSLAPDAAEPTFALLAAVRPGHDDLGVTIPGRWRRSGADADRAVALNVAVRVVKGQWRDPAAPSMDPRTGFLEVVDRLAGRAVRVGVATHDAPLARAALSRLRAAGTPCELELLLGLPFGPALGEAREAGVEVRVYVPYGWASLPYSVSGSASKPRALYRIVRDLLLARPVLPPPLNGARPAR